MGTSGSPLMGTKNKGDSAVFGPDGRCLTKRIEGEGLVFADLDLGQVTKAKTFADATGHYSRPDMLWLGSDSRDKNVIISGVLKKTERDQQREVIHENTTSGQTKKQ